MPGVDVLADCFERIFSRNLESQTVEIDENPLRHFESSGNSGLGSWWPRPTNEFFFVFREGIERTNLQYAELYSLLRRHCTLSNNRGSFSYLRFETRETVEAMIRSLAEDYYVHPTVRDANNKGAADENTIANLVANRFLRQFECLAIVEPFAQSCSVAIPLGLDLDLEAVVGLSGYIHSAGRTIYRRPIAKARYDEFERDLRHHLKAVPVPGGKKRLFVPFAVEDFLDGPTSLDALRIPVEKWTMGGLELPDVFARLRRQAECQAFLEHASALDQRSKHRELRRDQQVSGDSTIWFFADKSAKGPPDGTFTATHYICYEQLLTNCSPFLVMDEDKVGWLGPVTCPHSLTSAFLNLAIETEMTGVLVDPFSGSGTTAMEGLKFPNLITRGSDLDPLSADTARFNEQILALSSAKLLALRDFVVVLSRVVDGSESGLIAQASGPSLEEAKKVLDWALALARNDRATPGNLDELALHEQAAYFLSHKARAREMTPIWRKILQGENRAVGDLSNQILVRTLEDAVRYFEQLEHLASRDWTSHPQVPSLQTADGEPSGYSRMVTVASRVLAEGRSTYFVMPLNDESDLTPANFIVCDPPYGVNTSEDVDTLAELYDTMICKCLEALAVAGGSLVLCLPEQTFSGRPSGSFTHRKMVELALQVHAADGQIRTRPRAIRAYGLDETYRSKYYWRSRHALERTVLHYEVMPNSVSLDNSRA